jgi:hypothetical protein
MLKLNIYCTRFQSNCSSCIGRSSENISSSSAVAQGKGKRQCSRSGKSKEGMKLSLPPKLVENPVTHLMPYYAKTGRSRPLIA